MSIVANLIVALGADTRQLDAGLNHADRSVSNMARTMEQGGRGFDAFGEIATGAMRRVGELAIDLGLQMGRLAIGGFGAAAEAGMDFEATMSGVQAVSLATADEMRELSAVALRIGADTSFGAGEAAAAMEMLAANGLNVAQIMGGAADSTVALAAATGADLVTAANVATDTMQIFGLSAEELSQAVDGISGVTVASKFDINDYALALAQAGGVASSVGVSLDDFNASIAAISPLFASGSDAGTSFKTMLQRLIPASNPARDAMMELGLLTAEFEDGSGKLTNAFFDQNGAMKDMAEIAGILNKAFVGLSEEAKNEALQDIFGTDASRAAIALANAGTDGLMKYKDAIGEVDAAAQAATRLDNLQGDIEALSGTLETVGIEAFRAFSPALRDGTQALNAFVSRFVGFDYAPIVGGINRIVSAATSLVGAFNHGGFKTLFAVYEDGTSNIGAFLQKLGATESVAYGVGNALARLGQIVTKMFSAQGRTDLFASLASSAQEQLDNLQSIVATQAPIIWGNLVASAQGKFSELQSYVMTQGPVIVQSLIASFQSNLPGWIASLQSFATPLANWILEAIPQAAANFLAWRNTLVNYALSSLPSWMDVLGQWAGALGNWILDALPGMIANFTTATVELINIIGANLPAIIDKLGEWAMAFGQWIIDAGPGILANLGVAVGAILDALGANLPAIVEKLAEWGARFVGWALDALPGMLESLGGLIAGMLAWIGERTPEIVTQLGIWAGEFVKWIIPAGAELLVKLGEAFGNMLIWLAEKQPEINAEMTKWGVMLGLWIKNVAVPETIARLGEWWSSFVGWIMSHQGILAEDGTIGKALVDGIWKGITDAWGKLSADFNNLMVGLVPEQFRGQLGLDFAPSSAIGGGGGSFGPAPDVANGLPAMATAANGAATVVNNYAVTVQGNVTTEADLAEAIRIRNEDYTRRNG